MRSLVCVVAIAMILSIIGCSGGGKKTGNIPANSSSKTLLSFTFEEYSSATVVIDEPSKAVTVTLPFGANAEGLTAVFQTTGVKTCIGSVEQQTGSTTNDFTQPVVYTVYAEDGSKADYTVTVLIAQESANDITSFSINGVSGSISGTTITLKLPFGASLASLVADFTTTGDSVHVDGVPQQSGVTSNSFAATVEYVVTAANGSTKTYYVTVTIAQSDEKAITAFSVAGQAGIISGTSISVLVPNGTSLTGLVATFTATGSSVTADGITQTSGSTAVDFSSTVTYIVYAADNSTETYFVTVTAAGLGEFHPASGAYSPVSESSWGSAAWVRGAEFTSGEGSTLDVGVYSKNATVVVLEIYTAASGVDAAYDYRMIKGSDDIWRAAVAQVPGKTFYAFRAWGPNWTFDSSWTRGNSDKGFVSDVDSSGNRFNPNKVLYDPYAKELSHDKSSPAALGSENGGIYGTGGTGDATAHGYSGPCTGNVTIDRRNVDTGKFAPKSVAFVDSTSLELKPAIAQKDAIIYEAHVRGLTKHSSSTTLQTILSGFDGFSDVVNVPDAYRGTYKGAGYMAGYLKDLGVNTIELLPVQETDNDHNPSDAAGGNYWGYMTYGYFAPDRRYAYDKTPGGPTKEFKEMVNAFHTAGIEVYMDVVYNHTGEGGNWDSARIESPAGSGTWIDNPDYTSKCAEITSFRGLDNSAYYCLADSNKGNFWETTGCGNNFRCDNDPVRKLILDSLGYWIDSMGVDGFRFDLAPVLGREQSGSDWLFNTNAATITQIRDLGANKHVEMIAEAWDCGWPGGYQVSNFTVESASGAKDGWGEWNGFFRDSVRKYIKGQGWKVTNYCSMGDVFNGSYDLNARKPAHNDHDHTGFNDQGGPQKSVNFITAHDGFTMMDLVSYNGKSNSGTWPFGTSDGGSSDNDSWDSSPSAYPGDGGTVSGITQQQLRRQQLRNLWTILIMSRGVPMSVYGDEFGRTQNGNNNAYNLDSVATWSNYGMINTDSPTAVALGDGFTGSYHNNFGTDGNTDSQNGLFKFVRNLIDIRKKSDVFRQDSYGMVIDYKTAAGGDLGDSDRAARIFIDGSPVTNGNDYLICMNMWRGSVSFTVPAASAGMKWISIIDTANWAESGHDNFWTDASASVITGTYGVNPMSIVVLKEVSQ
jgi:glycogen operon protein